MRVQSTTSVASLYIDFVSMHHLLGLDRNPSIQLTHSDTTTRPQLVTKYSMESKTSERALVYQGAASSNDGYSRTFLATVASTIH